MWQYEEENRNQRKKDKEFERVKKQGLQVSVLHHPAGSNNYFQQYAVSKYAAKLTVYELINPIALHKSGYAVGYNEDCFVAVGERIYGITYFLLSLVVER